jgi:bifunctional non-homologous end joining protein LigD
MPSYREKRDFSRTNEPTFDPRTRPAGSATWKGAFVVHQHDATHLHYDLRLEAGGALLSFAVPKGPTLDPELKHFAAETEDHPLEYLDFEGVIPEGTYGAGPMIAWDLGVVRYLDQSAEDGLRDGKLHFALEGRKLRGRFGLVRLQGKGGKTKEWLLIKKVDAAARVGDLPAERPRSVLSGLTIEELREAPRLATEVEARASELVRSRGKAPRPLDGRKLSPMLCTLGELPDGPSWLYELKMDGVRVVATKDERGVDLRYRSGRSATAAYPEVARAIATLPSTSLVLDGEVVAFDDAGRPNFERLATRIHGSVDLPAALAGVSVVYMIFDLLRVGGVTLVDVPLVRRKALLAELVRAPGILRVLDHLDARGAELFAFCKERGLEGVVSKRADSRYHPGPGRTLDWIKTKCEREGLFAVVGYTVGENSRKSLGALDLASFDGTKYVVTGKVGSGLTDERVVDLRARLRGTESSRETATGGYDAAPRGRTFVKPTLVVRVRYLEFSEDGALRFPVYLGIEHDASPEDCRVFPVSEGLPDAATPPPEQEPEPELRVRLTNQTKIFWPESGLTKGDLVEYYRAIAPVLLPYLDDRPVMLVRYPDGIDGKNFYQWNVPHGMPSWVRSVTLGKHAKSTEEGDHTKHVFLIDRPESLLYIANLACIPIHVLGSRVASPSDCDFLVVDFDVNLASLETAIPLAHALRGILEAVGLEGFPKTSGQTGLHVFVPLGRGVTPESARVLADLLGRILVDAHPNDATMERVVAKRGARVYVDTGQTGPGRTIVAPYSVRATPGARVSTPLTWDEVAPGLDPGAFTIRTVPNRIRERGDLMARLLQGGPAMPEVMGRLSRLVGK